MNVLMSKRSLGVVLCLFTSHVDDFSVINETVCNCQEECRPTVMLQRHRHLVGFFNAARLSTDTFPPSN